VPQSFRFGANFAACHPNYRLQNCLAHLLDGLVAQDDSASIDANDVLHTLREIGVGGDLEYGRDRVPTVTVGVLHIFENLARNRTAMPTLLCKQMTYEGIDRVSKESFRGIDHSRLLRHNTAVAGRKPAANANQEISNEIQMFCADVDHSIVGHVAGPSNRSE
jgi:hypothetical protein